MKSLKCSYAKTNRKKVRAGVGRAEPRRAGGGGCGFLGAQPLNQPMIKLFKVMGGVFNDC